MIKITKNDRYMIKIESHIMAFNIQLLHSGTPFQLSDSKQSFVMNLELSWHAILNKKML